MYQLVEVRSCNRCFHLQFPVCYRAHDASVYGHILGLLCGHDDTAHRGREGAKAERGERINFSENPLL